jgi:hypothetical protein
VDDPRDESVRTEDRGPYDRDGGPGHPSGRLGYATERLVSRALGHEARKERGQLRERLVPTAVEAAVARREHGLVASHEGIIAAGR